MVDPIPTIDVLRAISVLLGTPDTKDDSRNTKHQREVAPAEEGWFLPRDLSRPQRSSIKPNEKRTKACADTGTTRLRNRLVSLGIVDVKKGRDTDVRGRQLDKNPPTFIRLKRTRAAIKKIDSLIARAALLQTCNLLPGVTKADLLEGQLAVVSDWNLCMRKERVENFVERRYEAYKYHVLRAENFEDFDSRKRLDEELEARGRDALMLDSWRFGAVHHAFVNNRLEELRYIGNKRHQEVTGKRKRPAKK